MQGNLVEGLTMKTRKCPVCGTEFDISKNKEKKTCSRSCAGKLSAMNFPERKCELCGKMFKPTSSMSRYCDGPHYKPCEVCGKDIEIPKGLVTNPPRCCSTECSNKLRENTCLERYGVSIASQNPETREKLRERALDSLESKKQTCLERYGVDNVAKLPEVQEKIAESTYSKQCLRAKKRKSPQHFSAKVCIICGKTFTPTSSAQKVCTDRHFKSCEICGQEFEISVSSRNTKTCSIECTEKLRESTMLERHGSRFSTQSPEILETIYANNITKYGVKIPSQSDKVKEKAQSTFLERYGVTSPFKMDDFQEKSKQTCLERYGVEFTSQAAQKIEKTKLTCMERYGSTYPLGNTEIRKRASRNNTNPSSLEIRLYNFLDEYGIEYQTEYVLSSDNYTHAFDVYLPKYKILIDCDGIWYHGYLSDPDGGWVLPDNDTKRLDVVPKDHIFKVIVEDDFERGLRDLQNTIKCIDEDVFDYEGDMFKWCRSINFPYPDYTEERIRKDYQSLCNLSFEDIKLRNWSGLSTIRQFHRSLWKDKVKGHKSVYEAWHEDELLKKVIANRLIYVDNVDPSKVLNGFNISKIAPRVSIFNPVLANYLIRKYLNKYPVIFDPFSGYSGRLLGAASAGKCYIGQDLNEEHVRESNQIIQFHNLTNCIVTQKDVLESHSSHSCLFTCPPYGDLEIYLEGQVIKSCDDWIDICLKNFKCDKYLFVVNKTEKYKDDVVEEIGYTSYFRKSKELVILIYQ